MMVRKQQVQRTNNVTVFGLKAEAKQQKNHILKWSFDNQLFGRYQTLFTHSASSGHSQSTILIKTVIFYILFSFYPQKQPLRTPDPNYSNQWHKSWFKMTGIKSTFKQMCSWCDFFGHIVRSVWGSHDTKKQMRLRMRRDYKQTHFQISWKS